MRVRDERGDGPLWLHAVIIVVVIAVARVGFDVDLIGYIDAAADQVGEWIVWIIEGLSTERR